MAMTAEGGYLPCLNPHCKSNGKSHPNCKCYSHLAEGGEASFCGSPRTHSKDCEYYAEGGELPQQESPIDESMITQESHGDQVAPEPEAIPQVEVALNIAPTPHVRGTLDNIFAKVTGQAALNHAIGSGLIQGGDDISNSMLGRGDPTSPVASALANMTGHSLLTGAPGGPLGGLGKGLEALGKLKFIDKAHDFLAGIGVANLGGVPEGAEASKAFAHGVKFYKDGMSKMLTNSSYTGSDEASKSAHKFLGPYLEKFLGIPLNSAANKYIVPTVLKVLSNGGDGADLGNAVNYAMNVGKGMQKISSAVDSMFKGEPQQASNPEAMQRNREKLRKTIQNRDLDKQIDSEKTPAIEAYAEGGTIQSRPSTSDDSQHLANHYPEQNMMLQAARSRVDGYLNSMRPIPKIRKPAYDSEQPNKHAHRVYDRALDIANHPLSVMEHVGKGTLTPEHMTHLGNMYPEIHNELSKEVSKKILQQQLKGEKLPYKTRQSLSLFLGSPLDSTFSPGAMASIQQQYMAKPKANQGQAPGSKPKHSTAGLDEVAKSARTPGQAREQRASKP